MFVGCSLKTKEDVIVKYYTQTLAYNAQWYKYKPQHSYYNEAPNDFNISKPFSCNEPWDGVSEVFFKDQEAYKKNIPLRVTEYCSNFFIDEDTNVESYVQYIALKQKYDNKGRLISETYPPLKQKILLKYTKNTKEITTYHTDSNKTEASKYIYDNQKNLLKILEYKNGKHTSVYLFNKKDKNQLLEYDMNGRFTGEFISLYEDPSN